MKMRLRLIACACTCALAAPAVVAQQPVFRSAVAMVAVDVSVRQGGRPIANLTARDFEVLDGGRRQTIAEVRREDLPIDVTCLVDLSQSVSGPLFASVQRAVSSVGDRLRPTDRAALITFNERVHQVTTLEAERPTPLAAALGEPAGFTSLFDALAMALIAPQMAERRSMVIVFSDGRDFTSFLDPTDLIDVVARSSAAVFIVAVTDGTNRNPRPVADDTLFRSLTSVSGGFLQVLQRDQDLNAAFARAFDEFRASYVLHYSPSGTSTSGWHDVTVRVTKPGDYQVRARTGYIAQP